MMSAGWHSNSSHNRSRVAHDIPFPVRKAWIADSPSSLSFRNLVVGKPRSFKAPNTLILYTMGISIAPFYVIH